MSSNIEGLIFPGGGYRDGGGGGGGGDGGGVRVFPL